MIVVVVCVIITIIYKLMKYILHIKRKEIYISGITSKRRIASTNMWYNKTSEFNPDLTDEELKMGTRMGSDSHADTSCVNKHAYVETIVDGLVVDAIPFDERIGKLTNLPIVHAVYAVDNTQTYETILIRINHAIYVKDMANALLCPNQARSHGTVVDDVPPHLDHSGYSSFAIHAGGTSLPFELHGPTSYIHVRRPTEEELSDGREIIDITDPSGWNPYGDAHEYSHVASLKESGSAVPNGFHEYCEVEDRLLYSDVRRISQLEITNQRNKLTTQHLAKLWGCGLVTAKQTIEATTCRHYRQVDKKGMTKRFRSTRDLFRYKQISIPVGQFYSDTLFSKVKSLRGFTCVQLYGNKFGFMKAYPMETNDKQSVGDTLTCLIQDVGVPQKLHTDNAKEMIGRGTPFFKRSRREGIDLTSIEPYRHNENYAENLVRQLKLLTSRLMHKKMVPLRLWCYAAEYASEIYTLTVPGMYRNKGRTGYELVYGLTPDISEYVEFEFYDYCWYWDTPQSFPHEKKNLGRWLGVAQRVGQAMVYFVMNSNGKVIARSTVVPLEEADYSVTTTKQRMADLDNTIVNTLGDYKNATNVAKSDVPDMDKDDIEAQLIFCFDLDQDVFHDQLTSSDTSNPEYDDAPTMDVESEEFDKFLGVHIEIPSADGEGKVLAKVKERKRDINGELIGSSHPNPILNTAVYKVESPDGTIGEYTANVIAENIYQQVDDDGFNYDLLFDIVDYRKDESAVKRENGYYTTPTGGKRKVITTKGWHLQVKWENGEMSWVKLKDAKNSNPIEVAQFAMAKGIENEPAFAWWVKPALRKRKAIISKASTKHPRKMKFGVKIPLAYDEAVILDRENGNTLWQDAVKKEMKNVEVAFNFLGEDESVPIGFNKISCHLIFDVKFSLERKARYVAGGHLNSVPPAMTYASVVSRDSVRIMFLLAALNDLNVKMCDIGNAYLNAETRERVWFTAGSEWGSRKGAKVIIKRALYGLKSSGAEWKKVLADYIKHTLGFEPCYGADDNVYLRAEKDEHGNEYYSYIACFVDDILCIHKDPNLYLDHIGRDFRLKTPPGFPTMYLGGDISKYDVPQEGSECVLSCWAMSADSHIKKALEVVKVIMNKEGVKFRSSKRSSSHPFSNQTYRPELDVTEYCDKEQIALYQSLVGILRWLCELGRIDILTETSLLSHYLVSPRKGHLHQAIHVFKYLEDHKRSKLVFDPSYPNISDDHLPIEERATSKAKFMKELYKDATEDIPKNAPKSRGKPVTITCFVDADHAGDSVTRRSRTGILIFVNSAPVIWYSKRQNTVETSTFGSEFVAMRQAFELIKSLRYKLRMFGVEIIQDGTKIFGDNNAVILNSSCPESTLSKKHHSINYHYVRECVASGIGLVYKVDTGENLADLFTKVLSSMKRKAILRRITY